MGESIKLSPQGYVYGIKPTSENPFWGSGEITGDYVSDVTVTSTMGTDFYDNEITVNKSDGTTEKYNVLGPLTKDPDIVTGMQVTQTTTSDKTDIVLTLKKGSNGTVEEDLPDIIIPLGGSGTTPVIDATATVDDKTGAPVVTVTKTGTVENPKFTFAFSGIKGNTGEQGGTPEIGATASVTSSGTTGVTVTKTGTTESPSFDFAFTGIGSGSGSAGLMWTDTAWLTCTYYGSDGAVSGDQVKMNITVAKGDVTYAGVAYAKVQSIDPVQLATTPCVYVLTNNADITDQHLIMQSGTYVNMQWDSATGGYTGSYGMRELYSSSTSPLDGATFAVYCEKIAGGGSGVSTVTPSVTVENTTGTGSSEYMYQKTTVDVDIDGTKGTAEASIKTPARVVTGVASVPEFDYGTTCYLEAKSTMGGTTDWQDDNQTSPLFTVKQPDENSNYYRLGIGNGGGFNVQKPLVFDGSGNVSVLNPFTEAVEKTIAIGGGGSGSGLPEPLNITLQGRQAWGADFEKSGIGTLKIELYNQDQTDGFVVSVPAPYVYHNSVGDIRITTMYNGYTLGAYTARAIVVVYGSIYNGNMSLSAQVYRYKGGDDWTAETFAGTSYWDWTAGE